MKKRIDIEKLLKWAYCEELPKGARDGVQSAVAGSNFLAIIELGLLGTRVDTSGRAPDRQFSRFDEVVHPDAMKVHEAVCSFNFLDLDLPPDWCPMPELAAFGEHGRNAINGAVNSLTVMDGQGQRWLQRPVGQLVQTYAIMGGCPDGSCETPELLTVCGEHGGPVWFRLVKHRYYDDGGTRVTAQVEQDDGWDKYRKRPKRGAYQKRYLHPDPHEALVKRGEYQLWLAALGELVEMLGNSLTDYEPVMTPRPAEPWNVVDTEKRLRGRPIRIARKISLTAT
ncbi:hypothetical protein Q669_24150 [Labrenzia sp. C1B10]|uniref:hypothetical protein n=1 Tax=unclassified Labrenzia TaxID=2648686 RepID=UPI0003B804DC|nr:MULTISPECIES: hypothetical protein [unclassified Labrenzia]ERP98288.1 hypothetical protein Q669_24150 [Labrenzia sp. C1B10]ERS02080.1 hypothetical protein Q675_08265 [Labrenzia sp. C1B70]